MLDVNSWLKPAHQAMRRRDPVARSGAHLSKIRAGSPGSAGSRL